MSTSRIATIALGLILCLSAGASMASAIYDIASPKMTANNAPVPYVASGCSDHASLAWHAWDGDASSGCGDTTLPADFQVDLGSAVTITYYTLYGTVSTGRYPIDFTLQYSNDSSTWNTADARTGQTTTSAINYTPTTITSARYWRVHVTSSNIGGWTYVSEVVLYSNASSPTPSLRLVVNDTRTNTPISGFSVNYTTTNATDANAKQQYCSGTSCTITNYTGTINISVYNISNNTYFPTTLSNIAFNDTTVTANAQTYRSSLNITGVVDLVDGTYHTYCVNATDSANDPLPVQCSGALYTTTTGAITKTYTGMTRVGSPVECSGRSTNEFCIESGWQTTHSMLCNGVNNAGWWNGAGWASSPGLEGTTSITCWNSTYATLNITPPVTLYQVRGNITLWLFNISNNTYFNQTGLVFEYNQTNGTYLFGSSQAFLNVTAYQGGTNYSISTFNATNGIATGATTNYSIILPAKNGTNTLRVEVAGNTTRTFSVIVGQLFTVTQFAATGIYDAIINASGGGSPATSGFNCTSCYPPSGSTISPYVTADTTPTFRFTTTVNANCRIANQDWNYTTMGPSRNCASGDGLTRHICTLTAQDNLTLEFSVVYVACQNSIDGNQSFASTSGPLLINGVATTPQAAEDAGIHQSVVWPQATVYHNQQVYLRDLNNNQKLATVDRVVVFGNQRWLINYHNGSSLGLFNISPVVYSLDLWDANITLLQIESNVTSFINATKQ